MARRRRLRDLAFGPRLRRRSARVRLTALYCCLLVPSGVAIAVTTYILILMVELPTSIAHLGVKSAHGASAKPLRPSPAVNPAAKRR